MVVSEVGLNLFQFKFQTEFDMERILKEGSWVFDNQVLLLRHWEAGMTTKNVRFDSLPIWIQIWDAPFDMVCSQVTEEVRQRLGRVVEVERRRGHIVQNLFMRVKVANDLEKPLQRGGYLLDLGG